MTNGVSLEFVAHFLAQEGWSVEWLGEQTLLRAAYQGNNGQWLCLAHVRPQLGQVVFYSIAPLHAPEVLRPAVAEFITRANWEMVIGNFEMDYADGEVRFKTSIQLDQTALTAELLRPLIYSNVAVMDQYLPGLQAVIGLTHTPGAAINAIEAG